MAGVKSPRPDRRVVEAMAEAVAKAANISLGDLYNLQGGGDAPYHWAVWRALTDAGFAPSPIASVWGASNSTACRAVKRWEATNFQEHPMLHELYRIAKRVYREQGGHVVKTNGPPPEAYPRGLLPCVTFEQQRARSNRIAELEAAYQGGRWEAYDRDRDPHAHPG